MKKLIISLLLLTIGKECNAEFSFKKITSWVSGHKSATLIKEIEINKQKKLIFETDLPGSISIKTWSLPKIALHAIKNGPEKELDHANVITHSSEKKILIRCEQKESNINCSLEFNLIIPHSMNLKVSANQGPIKIRNSHGELELKTEHGEINVQDAYDSIRASTPHAISITMNQLPLNCKLDLKSEKGAIDLGLPKNCHAEVTAKTHHKTISSEHFITLNPTTLKLNKDTWSKMKKSVVGKIGNGGTKIALNAHSGIELFIY